MMRAFRLMLYFVVGLALGTVSVLASATTLIFDNKGNIVGSWARGNVPSITFSAYGSGATGGVVGTGAGSLSVTSGAVPTTVPLSVAQRVTAGAIGRLAAGIALGTVPPLVVTAAVVSMLNQVGVSCDDGECKKQTAPGQESETMPAEHTYQSYPLQNGSWYSPVPLSPKYKTAKEVCDWLDTQRGVPIGTYQTIQVNATTYGCKEGYAVERYVYKTDLCAQGHTADTTLGICKTPTVYSCPSGQSWVLSGSTCYRTACTANQYRDEYGVCQAAGLSRPSLSN